MTSLHALDPFCSWLEHTPLSQTLQNTEWIIPAVQTVHILSVAAVMSSVVMIDLRLLGISGRDQAIRAVAGRFLPYVWWPLPILLASGALLIVAEPARALENPVFIIKMSLLVLAAVLTLACQIPLRRDATYWEHSPARRRTARLIAVLSLPVWIAIVFAGRWIAYVQGT
ncbi:MAG TPA: DUF6644 family protein [Steroidobacteraceae bacterium]|nr:DUF6644 family protein [Steroidobacteraceae bacterium]